MSIKHKSNNKQLGLASPHQTYHQMQSAGQNCYGGWKIWALYLVNKQHRLAYKSPQQGLSHGFTFAALEICFSPAILCCFRLLDWV